MVKHYNLPSGMMIKTFYCHECGKKLKPHYTVKTLRKGDPEFRKNAKVGDTYILTAKEVKIYNSDSFYCDYCNKILPYENQCIIRKIQKIYNKKILSQEEIEIYFNDAKIAVDKEKKLFEIIGITISIILIVSIIVYYLLGGKFIFSINF